MQKYICARQISHSGGGGKKGREQTEHLLQSAPMGGAADITMGFCKFCSHYVDKGHRGTS